MDKFTPLDFINRKKVAPSTVIERKKQEIPKHWRLVDEPASTPEVNTTLTIYQSQINNQNCNINTLIAPLGENLSSSPTLLPNIGGEIAWDSTDPNNLYVCNGTVWNKLESTAGGGVTGPGSSVNNDIVTFNGTTGNVIKDSGINISNIVAAIGAFGSTPNANGLSLTSNTLNMQPADQTHGGGISTGSQLIGGLKDFSLSGIQLTATANFFTNMTGVLSQYAYFNNATASWGGAVTATAPLIAERIGNKIFVTIPALYNMTQVGATIYSSNIDGGIVNPFAVSTDLFSGPIDTIQASATGGVALGAAVYRANSGSPYIEIGTALTVDSSIGMIYTLANFETGQVTGWGNGTVPMTICFNVS